MWNLPLLVLTAAAVAAWVAGSVDGPLCDASSWAQPHGLWHVLTAVVVVRWAERGSRRRPLTFLADLGPLWVSRSARKQAGMAAALR